MSTTKLSALLLTFTLAASAASAGERRVRVDASERNQRSLSWPEHGQVYVDIIGTLRTGMLAIGGETTGIVVRAENMNWELAFGRDERLRRMAQRLDGRTVRVTGRLDVRRGVELGLRHIVHVVNVEAVRNDQGERRAEGPVYDLRRSRSVTILEDDDDGAARTGRDLAETPEEFAADPQPLDVSFNRRDEPRGPTFVNPSTEHRTVRVRTRDSDDDPLDPDTAAPRGTVPRYIEEEPMTDWNNRDELDEVFRDAPLDGDYRRDDMGTIIPDLGLRW